MLSSISKILVFLSLGFCALSCIDPFDFETQSFEGVLVVDAKLSNEVKIQEIILSRARPFELDSMINERNAIVQVVGGNNTTYNFEEASPGVYRSTTIFGAAINQTYQLKITTIEGVSFVSEEIETPTANQIKKVNAERNVQDDGDEGVAILVDTEAGNDNSAFLRYEYEEDYKIIAPFWNPAEFDIIADQLCVPPGLVVEIKQNTQNNRICYGHTESTNIILANSDRQTTNDLSAFQVRFVSRSNFSISHRYSILVKQFSLNQSAYSYYERLASFSESEDVFSSIQPGFLEGNIISTNSNGRVLGYFEVSSVSKERIFFNYTDFFRNEALPPYPVNCEPVQNPPLVPAGAHCTGDGISDGTQGSPLIDGIRAGLYVYHADNEITPEDIEANGGGIGGLGPFFTKFKPCGDCTVYGSNIKPEFWVE